MQKFHTQKKNNFDPFRTARSAQTVQAEMNRYIFESIKPHFTEHGAFTSLTREWNAMYAIFFQLLSR